MSDTRARRYLEVTYGQGKPVAAYLTLPRQPGDRAEETRRFGHGLLVDYAADGRPIGVEITSPSVATLADLNGLLAQLGEPPLGAEEWAPLRAA